MDFNLKKAKDSFENYKNKDFRVHQEEAINYILRSNKKVCVLEAATGSGKSLIAMTAGESFGSLTYMVHSKILQNQITSDFPEAMSLFGRSNYACVRNPELTCDECFADPQDECKKRCEYEVRKKRVLGAKLKILNYDYFLTETNYVGKFSGAPFVIVDEADNLENTLIGFCTLTFTPFALVRLGLSGWASQLKQTSKYKSQLLDSWQSFGVTAKSKVLSIINTITNNIKSCPPEDIKYQNLIKERRKIIRLQEKIDLFLSNVSPDWQLDSADDGKLTWRPLWLTPSLANEFFWNHGDRFVLMSASFYPRHVLAKTLGLDLDDMDYHMVPSVFPVENRPVYINSVANITAKTVDAETPVLVEEIKRISDQRPDVKGIVHAVSYKLSNELVSRLNNSRFITHNGQNRQEVLDMFMKSPDPLILISPSLERGVSLQDDLCRLIIIAKAPYLSLGDKIVKARLYSGKLGQDHYTATMLLTILQMCGRAVRSSEDHAETFILDRQVERCLTDRPSFLPEWFRDAINFEMPF